MPKVTNIFKIGNVLDPHIRIEGKCAECDGRGMDSQGLYCNSCQATGKAIEIVRLCDILPQMGHLATFVKSETDIASG